MITPHDLMAMRLVEAHEAGDFEALAGIWSAAAADPDLGRHLTLVESGLLAELDASPEPGAMRLTAADVAERLAVARKSMAQAERDALTRLADCEEELPESLSMRVVRGLWERLGLGATEQLAKDFLQQASALMLRLGTGEQRVALMAARAIRKAKAKKS